MLRFTAVILFAFLILILAGCSIDLSEQGQKDRAIAEKMNQDLFKRQVIFGDMIKEVTYNKRDKGVYSFKFLKSDLTGQDVWDWTLLMMQVVERAERDVSSGRGSITLKGYMGRNHVVTGKLISGPRDIPFVITLEGSMAGQEVIESYNPTDAKSRLGVGQAD
jgi:hypothetical protein